MGKPSSSPNTNNAGTCASCDANRCCAPNEAIMTIGTKSVLFGYMVRWFVTNLN